MFVCKKCNNRDTRYIGYANGKPYCRKCLLLKTIPIKEIEYKKKQNVHANIDYDLTHAQQKAGKEILNYIQKGKSVLVNAVCGAGKTEIVYQSIEFYLNQGSLRS